MSVLAGLKTIPLLIPSGTALTQGALPGDHVVVGLVMPAAWTAAGITFDVSIDAGVTWFSLNDQTSTEIAIATPAAGKYLQLNRPPFEGIECIRLRSGTSALPVNQAADRALILVTRKLFAVSGN